MKVQLTLTETLAGLRRLEEGGLKITLLGIGPMSENIIIATLELARDEDFPAIFIASRNQVDAEELGGGYVFNWDQKKFRKAMDGYAEKMDFKGLLFLCRDHGGPWHRDNEKEEMLSEKEAMERAKRSYLADLLAGFDVFHIDPTVDPHIKGYVPLEIVIRRTVELIKYIERERISRKIKPVSYEVGTEETAGGITDSKVFEGFIVNLKQELEKDGLPEPDFIVGQTGTLIKMRKQVGKFNSEGAKELAGIARRYGMGFKEHNADFLNYKLLCAHPDLGITGANTGPEFSAIENEAYVKLGKKEEEVIKKHKSIQSSNFIRVIKEESLKSGRWRKWLSKEEAHLTEEEIIRDKEKMNEIVSVCGRYVNDESRVQEARGKMFGNLKTMGIFQEPEREVIESVKKSIRRYVEAFNLSGTTTKIIKCNIE